MRAVIFCGVQGAGKSTFYRQRFFDSHVRINLDMLRTRHRENLLLHACLEAKQPFVVDNTNPTVAERAKYIAAAKAAGFLVAGCFFQVDAAAAVDRNEKRAEAQRVPKPALFGTFKRLQIPTPAEGFDELYSVSSAADGAFTVEPWRADIEES